MYPVKAFIGGLVISLFASSAYAYPPKPADWEALSKNAGEVIAAWQAIDYAALTQTAPNNENDQIVYWQEKFKMVDTACNSLRDQIGTGGLFGPEMWTQGFSQTCWSIASVQRSKGPARGGKICQEAKASLNLFKNFKPARAPKDYPLAADHVAVFSEINDMLKASVKGCK